jgi:hypothetical protein
VLTHGPLTHACPCGRMPAILSWVCQPCASLRVAQCRRRCGVCIEFTVPFIVQQRLSPRSNSCNAVHASDAVITTIHQTHNVALLLKGICIYHPIRGVVASTTFFVATHVQKRKTFLLPKELLKPAKNTLKKQRQNGVSPSSPHNPPPFRPSLTHNTHAVATHGAPRHPRASQLGGLARHRPPRGVGPRRQAQRRFGGAAADAGVQGVSGGGVGVSAHPAGARGVRRAY